MSLLHTNTQTQWEKSEITKETINCCSCLNISIDKNGCYYYKNVLQLLPLLLFVLCVFNLVLFLLNFVVVENRSLMMIKGRRHTSSFDATVTFLPFLSSSSSHHFCCSFVHLQLFNILSTFIHSHICLMLLPLAEHTQIAKTTAKKSRQIIQNQIKTHNATNTVCRTNCFHYTQKEKEKIVK